VRFVLTGRLVEWRGPSPYCFLPVPDEKSADIREAAVMTSYGWGVRPRRLSAAVEMIVRLQLGAA
jgi:hypothetical protein